MIVVYKIYLNIYSWRIFYKIFVLNLSTSEYYNVIFTLKIYMHVTHTKWGELRVTFGECKNEHVGKPMDGLPNLEKNQPWTDNSVKKRKHLWLQSNVNFSPKFLSWKNLLQAYGEFWPELFIFNQFSSTANIFSQFDHYSF